MITENVPETNAELLSAVAETTTAGSGGSFSWEILLLAGIVAIVIIALVLGGSSSD